MPNLFNRDFSGGWGPDHDPANAPSNVLVRSDNLELEEKGVLSLRRGSESVTNLGSGNVDALLSVELDGNSVVLAGIGTGVYADGIGLGVTGTGTGDTALDSVDGHALIASGTTKKKYDGTTVRNWGIATPLEAPGVEGSALSSLTIANFTQASAEFTADEGTIAYYTGQDGTGNGALKLTPAVGTGRGEIHYNFSSARDLFSFFGADGGNFDLFEFWYDDSQPTKSLSFSIMFGCDTGSDKFEENGYYYKFGSGLLPVGLTQPEIVVAVQEAAVQKPDEPDGGGGGGGGGGDWVPPDWRDNIEKPDKSKQGPRE